jgi:DNA-binding transcriptional regulator GbsR (MarR family)
MITRTFSIDPECIPPLEAIARMEDPSNPNVSRVVRRLIAEGLARAAKKRGKDRPLR